MENLRNIFQHLFNPLHMYCRMRDMGMQHMTAVKMCAYYERFFYRLVYRSQYKA
jgi:hypothetical protein